MALYLTTVVPHPTIDGRLRVYFNEPFRADTPFDDSPSLLTGSLGYWNLDGNSNSFAGSSNGSDTAISYVSGKVKQGASFNGTTSVINCGSSISLDSNNWTIALWVYPTATPAWARVISYYGNGPTIQAQSGAMWICHGSSSDFNMGFSWDLNQWNHMVVTRSGSTITAYKNGVQTAQSTGFGASYSADTSVRFGNSTAFNEPFTGTLDEIGIWSRALTSTEVTALHSFTGGNSGSTVPSNYSIPGITVDSVFGVTDTSVDLGCTGLVIGDTYTLTVSNIQDLATSTAITSPGDQIVFNYFATNYPSSYPSLDGILSIDAMNLDGGLASATNGQGGPATQKKSGAFNVGFN